MNVLAMRQKGAASMERQGHRALSTIVWASRAIGWILILLAILNVSQRGINAHLEGTLRLLISLILGLLGLASVVGVEMILRFFDKYLSRN
jgi:hypothetical protein